jgi:hypothetical protein
LSRMSMGVDHREVVVISLPEEIATANFREFFFHVVG